MKPEPTQTLTVTAPTIVPPANLVEVIARAAADPAIDVSKMERLLDMHERILKRQAEEAFGAAMAAAQAEMPQVVKRGHNPSTNSHFARFEHVNDIAKPIYTKHGLSLSFSQSENEGKDTIRVACEIRCGAYATTKFVDLSRDDTGAKGNQSKTKIHGEGSTFSYGRRYLTVLIFNMTLIGEDDDGNQGRTKRAPSQQADGVSPKALMGELWELLQPVRGDTNNWNEAKIWLTEQGCITGGKKLMDMNPNELREVIAKAKEKL